MSDKIIEVINAAKLRHRTSKHFLMLIDINFNSSFCFRFYAQQVAQGQLFQEVRRNL
jgi:hypothetical protein